MCIWVLGQYYLLPNSFEIGSLVKPGARLVTSKYYLPSVSTLCMWVCVGRCPQRPQEGIRSLKVELKVVSWPAWGLKTQSSGRAASSLNYWGTSPGTLSKLFNWYNPFSVFASWAFFRVSLNNKNPAYSSILKFPLYSLAVLDLI